MRTISIFDSTLRDGEQAPGFTMSIKEKTQMALMLESLGVDVIEAGFPAASPADFTSVVEISKVVKNTTVCALARMNKDDIKKAAEALSGAKKARMHVFIATSDIHLKDKLSMTREEVLSKIDGGVRMAKSFVKEVEFSAEDASRTDIEYLKKACVTAFNAGASIINLPDTVGYSTPDEYSKMVSAIKNMPELKGATISVHCHNDLGLSVANSLAGILAGADQVECALNGIGERAGNAALEEIVMNLKVRSKFYDADTKIVTNRIIKASKLLSFLTGVQVQPNKAITGSNAFAHEAGIHQHGLLKNRETYEIITPESIGLIDTDLVLGKHSGKHAFKDKLLTLGYQVSEDKIDELYDKFIAIADAKKNVSDKDIEAMMKNFVLDIPEIYKLSNYVINSSNVLSSTCSISLFNKDNKLVEGYAMGQGPIEAAFNAINNATGLNVTLSDYKIESVTGGIDAQGAVSVKIMDENGQRFKGYAVEQNIFEASIKSYINAISNMLH